MVLSLQYRYLGCIRKCCARNEIAINSVSAQAREESNVVGGRQRRWTSILTFDFELMRVRVEKEREDGGRDDEPKGEARTEEKEKGRP